MIFPQHPEFPAPPEHLVKFCQSFMLDYGFVRVDWDSRLEVETITGYRASGEPFECVEFHRDSRTGRAFKSLEEDCLVYRAPSFTLWLGDG